MAFGFPVDHHRIQDNTVLQQKQGGGLGGLKLLSEDLAVRGVPDMCGRPDV